MNHVEAFCVMTYRCEKCERDHFYWNSRDGVTPFTVSSPCCYGHGASHVNWRNDTVVKELPAVADFVFIDLNMDDARAWAQQSYERMNLGLNEKDFDQIIDQMVTDVYGDGKRPLAISRHDYLQRKEST